MTLAKVPYTGKATSLDEQISLLEQFGISIKDKETVRNHLAFVGYYRLFAYVKPFLQNSHTNVTFEQIWSLYLHFRLCMASLYAEYFIDFIFKYLGRTTLARFI